MIRDKLSQWWKWYGGAIQTRTGRDLNVIAIVIGLAAIGWNIYSRLPGPKPASVLEVHASAEWRGSSVMITLKYRVNKVRSDCRYYSTRIVERIDERGLPKRFVIQGAQGNGVEVGDTSEQETNFYVPGDLMPPDDDYTLRIQGTYSCPNGNFVGDPVAAKFILPPKPEGPLSQAQRAPVQAPRLPGPR